MIKKIYKYRLYYLPFIFLIAALLFIRLKLIFSFSTDNDGLEYYFVHIVQEIIKGKPMYENPLHFPYSINLYTPIYFYFLSTIVSILKLNIYEDIHQILIAGRILSLFAVILQVIYLIKIMRYFSSSKLIIISTTLVYILLLSGHIYAVRPDSFKLLFFTMFLYYFIKYFFFSSTQLNAVLCICSSVLSVYSKQDIALYIILIFLTYIFLFRKKNAVILFIIFITCCLFVWILMWYFFGNYIFHNLILFNIQSVKGFLLSYNIIFILFGILRVFPLFILAILNFKKLHERDTISENSKFIIYSVVLSFPIAFLSLLRPGSNLNYTYELSILLVLNTVVFYSLNKRKILFSKVNYSILLTFYIIVLITTNALFNNYKYSKRKETANKKMFYSILAERNIIKEAIKNDTVYFPNTMYSIFYTDKFVVLGHDMHLDRFIRLYTNLDVSFKNLTINSRLPFIDTKDYDVNFTSGKIKYIIAENTLKSKAHVAYYYPDYMPYKITGNMTIYKFKYLP